MGLKKRIWIALVVFLLDRASKLLWPRIPPAGLTLIPGVVGLRPVKNTGMAFSLFSGHPWILAAGSLIILAGGILFFRGKEVSPLTGAGLMMMLGGAAGNLVDRFAMGYVPDMIELQFVRFAIFNLADAFLVIGCGLVILSLFRAEKHG